MFGFLQKNYKETKRQKTQSEETKEGIEPNSDTAEILELTDRELFKLQKIKAEEKILKETRRKHL